MQKRFTLLLLAASLFMSICSGASSQGLFRRAIEARKEHMQEARNAGGSDKELTVGFGGRDRSYRVHVPRSYDPKKPAALLMAFHGGGGDMDWMADDEHYGLVTKSESADFIVIFPSGVGALGGNKLAAWNAGGCCGKTRDDNVDDVGFVREILTKEKHALNIDPARIYATGMSNGGMMAQRLACEMSDVFAGIAAVAGTDNTISCTPARPISVLNIHARNDDHVLFNGGAGEGAFRDTSKVTNFTSVPETVARWVKRNRCSPTPVNVMKTPSASCEVYQGCSGGSKVELCVTEDGGHSWPGSSFSRKGKELPSQALSANDTMWSFFQQINTR